MLTDEYLKKLIADYDNPGDCTTLLERDMAREILELRDEIEHLKHDYNCLCNHDKALDGAMTRIKNIANDWYLDIEDVQDEGGQK